MFVPQERKAVPEKLQQKNSDRPIITKQPKKKESSSGGCWPCLN